MSLVTSAMKICICQPAPSPQCSAISWTVGKRQAT
jgi:hypothetical protein